MECNKDGASRAKELAEKMLLQKDLGGARMLAMKALELYPNLDGLPQLLATIDVYISAEKKVNGEVDWYRILGVQPLANEETIRRRYRKLALTLHPDKNKSVGAEGAFNLISQAWSLLSDKAKRITYDQKYNLWGIYHGNPCGKPSIPASQNGLYNNVFNHVSLKPHFGPFAVSAAQSLSTIMLILTAILSVPAVISHFFLLRHRHHLDT
ncbi:DnaJ-like subfamily B member 14 [Spatholobus suberectus]|nr:DnaJ-like subfamily B member 14 [Spatholobus suberectus]